jgi:hypothetical protein
MMVCISPFWGASLLSNFPEMYKGTNYYSVVPSYVCFFAAVMTVAKYKMLNEARRPVVLVLFCALAMCAGYRASPFGDLKRLAKNATFQVDSLSMIPPNLRVVASEFDSIFVLDKKQVIRQWLAERINVPWDVLLVRSGTREPPSAKLINGTALCFSSSQWDVYCKKGVTLNVP